MKVTASEFIAQSLVDAGVRTVYGGHGGALVPLVNAVVDHPELLWVCTRNEANASLMAAADAKLRLGLAACIATSGPGASNLVTGLLDAHLDRVPLIAITGTKPRSDLAHSEFQDIDQSRLFAAGGLSYSVTVSDPLQLVAVMRDAVATALTHHCCVHVGVPVDIQGALLSAPEHLCSANPAEMKRRVEAQIGDPDDIAGIAELLASGKERVVFAVGLAARQDGEAILRLAEMTASPVVTRLDAKGAIDESHPLALGVVGVHGKPGLAAAAKVISTSTLVVSFGVSDLTVLLCDQHGLQVRPMVEVVTDVLGSSTRFRALHTLVANPTKACEQLMAKLAQLPPPPPANDEATPWHRLSGYVSSVAGRLSDGARGSHVSVHPPPGRDSAAAREMAGVAAEAQAARLSDATSGRHSHCHPGLLLKMLSPRLSARDVVCVDTGDITLWASISLRLTRRSVVLSSERLGTMGYGLCAGIAASIERGGDARAIVIVGDGGFQMTLNELGTAIQHGCRLLLLVIDNGLLGRVEHGFKNAKGCEITGCDWVALARAYGADGMHVARDSEIEAALDAGLSAKGVFVLAARCDPALRAEMAKTSDGIMPPWLEPPGNHVESG